MKYYYIQLAIWWNAQINEPFSILPVVSDLHKIWTQNSTSAGTHSFMKPNISHDFKIFSCLGLLHRCVVIRESVSWLNSVNSLSFDFNEDTRLSGPRHRTQRTQNIKLTVHQMTSVKYRTHFSLLNIPLTLLAVHGCTFSFTSSDTTSPSSEM